MNSSFNLSNKCESALLLVICWQHFNHLGLISQWKGLPGLLGLAFPLSFCFALTSYLMTFNALNSSAKVLIFTCFGGNSFFHFLCWSHIYWHFMVWLISYMAKAPKLTRGSTWNCTLRVGIGRYKTETPEVAFPINGSPWNRPEWPDSRAMWTENQATEDNLTWIPQYKRGPLCRTEQDRWSKRGQMSTDVGRDELDQYVWSKFAQQRTFHSRT